MNWISVNERVPDNRRKVLAWGRWSIGPIDCGPGFLGETRFNPSPSGGKFDADRWNMYGSSTVTHWCEIVGPADGTEEEAAA